MILIKAVLIQRSLAYVPIALHWQVTCMCDILKIEHTYLKEHLQVNVKFTHGCVKA